MEAKGCAICCIEGERTVYGDLVIICVFSARLYIFFPSNLSPSQMNCSVHRVLICSFSFSFVGI